mgnify:CR=1 FL=1
MAYPAGVPMSIVKNNVNKATMMLLVIALETPVERKKKAMVSVENGDEMNCYGKV